jgi:glucosamine--fructose-6-phosphate aminotransferase (isomerizing)
MAVVEPLCKQTPLNTMTHFLDDILRQPSALASTIEFLGGNGRKTLEAAAALLRRSRHIYMTGIGSSYHAALGIASFFHQAALPVYLQDAAELAHFASFPEGSAIIVISRSGQSAEILNVLAKAKNSEAAVIALTNAADSDLAEHARIPILIPVNFDHAISVNTYSTLAAAGSALAAATIASFSSDLVTALLRTIDKTAQTIPVWQQQITDTSWLTRQPCSYYFLARGASLASCHETRLLWEEGVKHPATAMGTGTFRHGPQEMVREGSRFGLWVDAQHMRDEDIAVARDLGKLGASVLLIGQDLPEDSAILVLQTPSAPPGWQFLFDIIPAQLVAERLASIFDVDCDSFRICSHIVRNESGLLNEIEVVEGREQQH